MTTSTSEITIAAPLVRFLRRGLKRKLAATASTLYVQLEVHIIAKEWKETLTSFTDGCELLAKVGVSDETEPHDLTLDLDRWGALILRSLEGEYRDGKARIEDAQKAGYNPALIGKDIPALGELLRDIRKRTGMRPRRRRG